MNSGYNPTSCGSSGGNMNNVDESFASSKCTIYLLIPLGYYISVMQLKEVQCSKALNLTSECGEGCVPGYRCVELVGFAQDVSELAMVMLMRGLDEPRAVTTSP